MARLLWIIGALAAGLFVLYLVKLWLDRLTPIDDDHHVQRQGNLAVVLRRVGWFMAIALAVAGSLTSISHDRAGAIEFGLDVLVAFALVAIAGVCCNKFTLPRIDNTQAISANNRAVGLIEAGSYLGIGAILFGSFTGEGGGTLSALLFGALGVSFMVLCFRVIDRLTPVDLAAEVEQGNTAAALSVMGDFLGLGLILGVSIAGPFQGWLIDLRTFGASALIGLLGMLVVQKAIDLFFLPHTTIDAEIKAGNVAAMVLVEGTLLALVFIVVAILAVF